MWEEVRQAAAPTEVVAVASMVRAVRVVAVTEVVAWMAVSWEVAALAEAAMLVEVMVVEAVVVGALMEEVVMVGALMEEAVMVGALMEEVVMVEEVLAAAVMASVAKIVCSAGVSPPHEMGWFQLSWVSRPPPLAACCWSHRAPVRHQARHHGYLRAPALMAYSS